MNTPVIDPVPLDAIRNLQEPGQDSLLNTIIGMFVEQSVNELEVLRDAQSRRSADSIREAAHSLKSSSANVGAMRVSALSYDLEQAGRDGALDLSAMLIDRLALAIDEANARLSDIAGAAAA